MHSAEKLLSANIWTSLPIRKKVYLCKISVKFNTKRMKGGLGGGGVAEGVWRKHVCLAFAFALPCLPLRNIDVPHRNIALHGITLPLPGALLPLLLRSMMCTMCTAHVHIVQDFVQWLHCVWWSDCTIQNRRAVAALWWLWCSLSIAVCGELQNCHLVISASVTTPTHPRPPKIILFVFCFLGPIFTVILSLLLLAIFMLLLVLVTNHFPDLHPNHDLHVYSISCFYCVFWTQPKLAVLMLRRIWGLVLLLGLHYCCLILLWHHNHKDEQQ